MSESQPQRSYIGKYRGKVANNIDPERRGRLIAIVPSVSEFPLSWALPCAPMAGPGMGLFSVPPIGANIWVEFEGGNPGFPIWTGGFWADGQTPGTGLPTTHVWKTALSTVTLEDLGPSMSFSLKAGPGIWTIKLDPTGVTINTGTVTGTVQPSKIRLEIPGASAELAGGAVTLDSGGAATIKVEPAKISAVQAGSSLSVDSSEAKLASGTASVALSGPMVKLNNDGLVVT